MTRPRDESAVKEGPNRSPGLKIAHLISRLTHPLYLAPFVILAASLVNSSTVAAGFYWWGLYQVFATFIPLADLIWRLRTGRISDWHVSLREERKWPLIFGVIYAAAGSLAFYLLSGPRILLACMVAGLVLCILTLIITSYWKISLHMMGDGTQAIILLATLETGPFSLEGLLLLMFLLVVGASRYAVKAHTIAQIITGAAVGIGVTWCVFRLMGI
jgi:hypothetical protein